MALFFSLMFRAGRFLKQKPLACWHDDHVAHTHELRDRQLFATATRDAHLSDVLVANY